MSKEPLVWTVPDVLNEAECDALIDRVEALGPSPAPITTARGFVMASEVRNNERVMFDDVGLAERLFERVRRTLPDLDGRVPVGANERMRCYRYKRGQRFRPHFDGSFRRTADEESALTLMVYLNEGFVGGETAFLDLERTVTPRRGMALLFEHGVLHEGCEVQRGVKYALRSDVMYARRSRRTLALP
jgi:predicted 2-oxoglutarate/Fe(II)-dependent dioxygenase YbiX